MLGDLLLGVSLALALQLAFAALLTAGRAIDIQARIRAGGAGRSHPRAQMPLAGTFFAYAGAAIFFAIGAPEDLLAIWAASVEKVPLGAARLGGDRGAVDQVS